MEEHLSCLEDVGAEEGCRAAEGCRRWMSMWRGGCGCKVGDVEGRRGISSWIGDL